MNSEDIKELSKLGLSSDQIIAVIPFLEKILSRDVTLLSRRQSRDRERQRKFRAKTKQSIENEQKNTNKHKIWVGIAILVLVLTNPEVMPFILGVLENKVP